MIMKEFVKKFYLDTEKDIIINLYKTGEDEITAILTTPNHKSGNLITNLAKLFNVETQKDENDMKIIVVKIPASINGDNRIVYILRLGGFKIANIYEDYTVELKAKIPAITKTLMSQTKNYNLPIEKTIAKSYILKKSKLKTDLHTHMNANLKPDTLIALGIKHQLRYPLYYVKKLDLRLSEKQEKEVNQKREKVEKQFKNSELTGKYLTRKIDDNTFINFADLILNNTQNANYNISKIRTSLAILKDGQAVFTNLEKLYIYRYVFCKGIESEEKIEILEEDINKIPEEDIKNMVKSMFEDNNNVHYKNLTLRQDKFLWIARDYQKHGIAYAEVADTDLAKANGPAIKLIEELHQVLPYIEEETGVKLRFLVALRRIPLTIIKDQIIEGNYLRENLDVLKAVSKSPYVVGSDFIGEEINDIEDLKPAIEELVDFAKDDEYFTIRIHAGENDSLRNNVSKSIKCVKDSLKPGQQLPRIRLGHGIYIPNLDSEEGKELIKEIKDCNVILEFQLTSNVRLNNLTNLKKHPLRKYLENGIMCVQGTDGCGFYGTNAIDEQLALQNLLGITDEQFEEMRKVEEELLEKNNKYFEIKSQQFKEFLNGRTIREALIEEEEKHHIENKSNNKPMRITNSIESEVALKDKISQLPENKMPIIIAGGSFNKKGRVTEITEEGEKMIEKLISSIDKDKAYFVIGHKIEGYEKAIIDVCNRLNKDFEIAAIVPKMISQEEKDNLLSSGIDKVRVSIESDAMGIYKSFNYEIFERRSSMVIAFDGNSPVSNLVQEAKNGKGKSKIYLNLDSKILRDKAESLEGYVIPFNIDDDIVRKIVEDNKEIADESYLKMKK